MRNSTIGRKWKGERREVKVSYKRFTEEGKRQHVIDHTGYEE